MQYQLSINIQTSNDTITDYSNNRVEAMIASRHDASSGDRKQLSKDRRQQGKGTDRQKVCARLSSDMQQQALQQLSRHQVPSCTRNDPEQEVITIRQNISKEISPAVTTRSPALTLTGVRSNFSSARTRAVSKRIHDGV